MRKQILFVRQSSLSERAGAITKQFLVLIGQFHWVCLGRTWAVPDKELLQVWVPAVSVSLCTPLPEQQQYLIGLYIFFFYYHSMLNWLLYFVLHWEGENPKIPSIKGGLNENILIASVSHWDTLGWFGVILNEPEWGNFNVQADQTPQIKTSRGKEWCEHLHLP